MTRAHCTRLSAFLVVLSLCGGPVLYAQKQETPGTVYTGTAGQQHVTVWLDFDGGALRGGRYQYDGQSSTVRFDEVRVFGTTAVLADEDGNTLHLHMKTASGGGTTEWATAAGLEGSLERGDLDLPVTLARTHGK